MHRAEHHDGDAATTIRDTTLGWIFHRAHASQSSMSAAAVPDWCRWRSGTRPLLLIAPHGGRADTTAARALDTKVNDVHTAELTWALAEALDASAIVNPLLDRNELDLNRISQVTRAATWFPALIERLLVPLLDRHVAVEVLFIHGWNVIQPKCDIGVGARFAEVADAHGLTQLTADAEYVDQRLSALQQHCSAAGIHTTFGERYPASHRNNLLQLFRRDGSRPCDAAPRICDWAGSGRLNAVQLELGVPLRWPGRLRDAFMRALITSASDGNITGRASLPASRDEARLSQPDGSPGGSPSPTMLLAYDPRAAIGFMSGVSVQPNGQLGGRLLVFSQGQTMSLFTGEDPEPRGMVVGGPRFSAREQTTLLSFVGPLLEVQDAASYLRLEHAFMQSRLIEADVTLTFDPIHGNRYGRVHGSARLDGVLHHIDTFGFRNVPIFLRRPTMAATRCAVAAAFGEHIGVDATTIDADTMSWSRHDGLRTENVRSAARILETRVPGSIAPAQLTLECDREQLLVHPLNHMQIHRPLPGGDAEMIFLGLARCELGARRDGYGLYEYVRRVPADSTTLPLGAASR